MSEKRKQTYMVGLSLIVTGLILLGSLFIILPYLLNLPPEDFHYYNNIHFVMLIFACVTILAGQCLVLYAKHPYYDYKWGNTANNRDWVVFIFEYAKTTKSLIGTIITGVVSVLLSAYISLFIIPQTEYLFMTWMILFLVIYSISFYFFKKIGWLEQRFPLV